jgi:hypothetical protein
MTYFAGPIIFLNSLKVGQLKVRVFVSVKLVLPGFPWVGNAIFEPGRS